MGNMRKTNKISIKILIAMMIPCLCFAGDNTTEKKIKSIEGVYKSKFKNMLYDGSGEKFTSEDIIEIVRYSYDTVYFRIELKFANNHSCSIYGIAKYNNGEFVFTDKNETNSNHDNICTLKISNNNTQLKITDTTAEDSDSTCSEYCGARGSLSNYEIDMSKKRKIRYMPIILKSAEYSAAVNTYNKAILSK